MNRTSSTKKRTRSRSRDEHRRNYESRHSTKSPIRERKRSKIESSSASKSYKSSESSLSDNKRTISRFSESDKKDYKSSNKQLSPCSKYSDKDISKTCASQNHSNYVPTSVQHTPKMLPISDQNYMISKSLRSEDRLVEDSNASNSSKVNKDSELFDKLNFKDPFIRKYLTASDVDEFRLTSLGLLKIDWEKIFKADQPKSELSQPPLKSVQNIIDKMKIFNQSSDSSCEQIYLQEFNLPLDIDLIKRITRKLM